MDDDRVRSLLLELYEEGAQHPPPMPVPPVADVRAHRPRAGWLLAGGAGLAAAAVVGLVLVVVPGGHRTGTSASGTEARQPSAAVAAPSIAPQSRVAQSYSGDSQLSSGGANAATGPFGTCDPRHLQASYSGSTSPMTGEHLAVISVRNPGPSTCVLAGYPAVQLTDAGSTPAVRYQNGSAPLEPAPKSVSRVELTPGASAHFVVTQLACQVSAGSSVSGLTYAIAGASSPVVAIPDLGSRGLQYCATSNDGGNLVSVGPFAPGATP